MAPPTGGTLPSETTLKAKRIKELIDKEESIGYVRVNDEEGANENDVNMRQITQSKNQFNHKSYSELSLGMEYDLDTYVLNEDIDDLLGNESPEISDDEDAALDITNLDSEIVNTFKCVDSGVDELVNSPVKDANLNALNKDLC